MPDNFFTDNLDLQFHLDKLDLSEVVAITEDNYRYSALYPEAPRNYAMPNASVNTAASVKPGFFTSIRKAQRRSFILLIIN